MSKHEKGREAVEHLEEDDCTVAHSNEDWNEIDSSCETEQAMRELVMTGATIH